MEIKDLCQTLSKAFDMSRPTSKVSTKSLKEDDQDSVRKASRLAFTETILAIREVVS